MKRATAMTSDLLPDVTPDIPPSARRLHGFRAWTRSRRFPEAGRIDYLGGEIAVDMSPEDLHTHGTLKSALAAELFTLVGKVQRGYVFIDSTRVTSAAADLSAEPDLVVVLFSSLDAGRVRQVPAAREQPGRFVELEGAPDLIVEIVSDGSERKDQRLVDRYARAGVPELWSLDARGAEVRFEVRTLSDGTLVDGKYQQVEADGDGWVASAILGLSCRVTRQPAPHAGWFYTLEHRRGR